MTYISEQDFKRLWSNAIISLDTSALLFLQECDVELAKHVMDTLLFVKECIWIPNHVASVEMKNNFEYKGHRSGAIGRLNKFNKTLESSISDINDMFKSMNTELREEGHDLLADIITDIDINKFLYDVITNFKQKMDFSTEENRRFLQSGLVQMFQKSVCSKSNLILTSEEISQIEQEGIARYSEKKPPGYCDWKKDRNEFGDLIIWKELLKKSSNENKPILFITRDKKDDWFEIENDEIIGVREELVIESKENKAEVYLIYFNDFVRMSLEVVSKNVEALVDKIDSDDKLLEQIEVYINDNMYGAIQDELTETANIEHYSDFTNIDVIENVIILENEFEIFDDQVVINSKVEFDAYVDHNFYIGSKEPNMEFSGVMNSQIDVITYINVLSGEHNDKNKTLDISSIYIELGKLEVINSTDPFGDDDDEEYEEPDFEYEYEEPDFEDKYGEPNYDEPEYDDF